MVARQAPRWSEIQLYGWKDRGRSQLVTRAAECGYSTFVLTVDVPVAGARPGVQPGDLAASDTNPVVWRRS